MAFGRSNSLSLNTAQTNSLFSQQQNQSSQAPPAGGLFGNTNTSQAGGGGGGGLFGSTATSNPNTGGGLFGNPGNNQTATPRGALFSNPGNNMNQTSNTAGGGGLFSNNANNQSKPGGLFGNSTTNMPATGSSLFGGNMAAPAAQQTTTTGGGLFSTSTNNSLFGGKTAPDPKASWGGNMFHQANEARNNPPPSGSAFGLNAWPAQLIPSLLPSAQYRQSQTPATFVPRLSMGQGNNQQQSATVGAVNVGVDELRGTTRFQDLKDELKKEFEAIDEMIKKQEKYALDVQNFMNSSHPQNVASIEPDVELIKDKTDNVEKLLVQDAHTTEARKQLSEDDWNDFQRCMRVAENLKLPHNYQVPSTSNMTLDYGNPPRLARPATDTSTEDVYDTDLINNYFTPLASNLSKQLSTYDSNLGEIEAHMKVIEQSAVHQAQMLAAKRAGISAPVKQEDTVQELSQTLIGFEQSILGVAGAVGECRAGLDELVVGRLGAVVGGGGVERY